MKVIFMGTPDFAVNTLEKIIEAGHEVMLVVTQPDKPKGRGNTMQFPPVKECAVSHGLEVFQPVKIREDASVEYLKKFAPDIIIVAAFGQILPKSILDLPKYGCINVHASCFRNIVVPHRSSGRSSMEMRSRELRLCAWMSDWIPEISLPKTGAHCRR